MIAARQMLLDIKLRDDATFANFVGDLRIPTSLQQQLCGDNSNLWYIYLWGSSGSGCSHLLQAACREGRKMHLACVYISLAHADGLQTELLTDLENQDLICLDDLDGIAGDCQWEEAVFKLFNKAIHSDVRLLIGSKVPPGKLSLELADLASRLSSGLVYHLQNLSDEQKLTAMRLRANNRGINLEPDVAKFIMARLDRGLDQLFAALDKLDKASLHRQRKVTINLAKDVLGI